jgi:hypothetical protein
MRKLIGLGAVSSSTKSTYFAGTVMDGVKAINPATGQWTYKKQVAGSRLDVGPPG